MNSKRLLISFLTLMAMTFSQASKAQYCTATSSSGSLSGSYFWIMNVTFNTLNHTQSSYIATTPYYINFPATGNQTTVVSPGQTYSLSVKEHYWGEIGVWFDWNNNGTFDPSEFTAVGNSYATYNTSYDNTHTVNITVPGTATPGQKRMRVRTNYGYYTMYNTDPCTTFPYGETHDYTITVLPGVQNDAGIAEILNPTLPTCDLDSVDITAVLQTYGSVDLTSCVIKYQIGSGSIVTTNYTGTVAAYGGLDTVVLGNESFTNGQVLHIWTSLPNGVQDSATTNDDAYLTVSTGLSGTYTIPGDYANLNAAKADLVEFGICGSVIFNMATNTYNEQVSFPPILGTSEDATITFQSATGNSGNVKIVQSASSSSNNYVVMLDGADWFNFKNLTIKNTTSGTYSNAVKMINGANHNTIDNCMIKAGPTSYTGVGDYSTGVFINGINEDISITNSRIHGGSCNIYWYGASTTSRTKGLNLTNNEIKNAYFYTIYSYYSEGLEMHGNKVTNDSAMYTYGYGPYFYYSDKFNITNNYIGTEMGYGYYYGFYLPYGVGYSNPRSQFANNCIYAGSSTSTTYGYYGVYMTGTGNMDFHNNSITRKGYANSTGYYTSYFGGAGNVSLKNNIFNDQAGSMALFISGGFTVMESDYNAFYSTNGTPFYFNNAYQSSLATYQQASGFDAHSIFENPQWQGTLKCITCSDDIGNGGTPLANVPTDIDGRTRSLNTPDIGAVEFVTPASFTLGGNDTLCGNSYEIEAGPAQSVAWGVSVNSGAAQSYNTPSITLNTVGGAPTTFDISVIINTAFCGSGTDQASILLVPDATLDSAMHICADETGTLAPGGGTSATYAWSTGATTPTIDVNGTGTYSVTKSELGCETQASIAVTQSTAVNVADIDACKADGAVSIDATIPDGVSYAWSGGSANTAAVNQFTTAGSYTLTATDNFGCVSTDAFVLAILDAPKAAISILTSAGTSRFFTAANSQEVGSNTMYSWLFNSIDVSTLINPVYIFPWSGVAMSYPVTVEVNNGCGIDSKTINVNIDPLGVEFINSGSFAVYPNPAIDAVKFVLTTAASSEGLVQLMDLTGRVISSQIITTGQTTGELNVVGLASGSYLVKMTIDGVSSVNPIVKQ